MSHGRGAGSFAARSRWILLLGALSLVLGASGVLAHAGSVDAGQGAGAFQMPAWVVWVAGAGVVAISFGLVGVWLTPRAASDASLGEPVEAGDVTQLDRRWVTAGRLVGLLALLGAIVPAFLAGTTSLLPGTVVWLFVWSGLPILAYLVGNAWLVVSPFRALAGLADKLRGGHPPLAYPSKLGAWPSVVVLLGLIGLETTFLAEAPRGLAWLVLAYTLFTILSMAVFGSRTWLAHGEALDRAFAWWSSMAPIQLTASGLQVGGLGRALAERRARDVSSVGVVLALLYGVNYDAFLGTGAARWVLDDAVLGEGIVGGVTVLIGGYLFFWAALVTCAWGVRVLARSKRSVGELFARFSVALLPIAAAYHLAHNAVYVVEQAPLALASLSDPLGAGWDLLGTTGLSSASVPGSLSVWLVGGQMALIVAGHVLAVVVAHRVAFGTFPSRVQAIKSELPLTAVMVLYTLVGLWLVSLGHAATPGGP